MGGGASPEPANADELADRLADQLLSLRIRARSFLFSLLGLICLAGGFAARHKALHLPSGWPQDGVLTALGLALSALAFYYRTRVHQPRPATPDSRTLGVRRLPDAKE